ncbi:holin [Enterobacter phage phiEap-1]|uniref:Holin n=1 Tax=Enterobacter phage phiEap-1 TaxID=1587520 RepID=A0A0K2FGX9_9CAUD|nr:holin [Enterobacter phage phiEap-1]ALA45102.1 lysis protein [Enterobacter phage phiEap-1]
MLSLDFNNEVVKAAPIVGTGVADGAARLFWGLSLNEWFYVAAIAYTVAQIGAKVVQTIIDWKKSNKEG